MNFDRAARHQACGYNHYLLGAQSAAWGETDTRTGWCANLDAAAMTAAMTIYRPLRGEH
jgi:hypothetical protein